MLNHKRLTWILGVLFLLSMSAFSNLEIANGFRQPSQLEQEEPNEDFDPDIPPMLRGKIDKAEFQRLRAEAVARLRGLPHRLPHDPRAKAIYEVKQAEARLSRRQAEPKWQEIGPAPIPNASLPGGLKTDVSGRVLAIAIHPTNPNIAYFGTSAGGLYRTLDGGKRWVNLIEEAQSLSVGAIAIVPSRPTTIYFGTGEAFLIGFTGVGVYRIDQAETNPTLAGPFHSDETGNDVFTGRSVSKILVHPTDPDNILVSTVSGTGGFGKITPPAPSYGIYRTLKAGSNSPVFTRLNVPTGLSRPVNDMLYEPGNPNQFLCLVSGVPGDPSGLQGIWRSTDIQTKTPAFQPVQPLNGANFNGRLAAAKAGSQVTVWAATSEFDLVKGCSSGGNVLGVRGGTLRKSTDAGATWAGPIPGISGFCGSQCFYNVALAIPPDSPNTVFIGGQGGQGGIVGNCASVAVGKSTDGITFARSDRGLYVDTHAIEIAPSDPSVVYVGDDAGIFKSTNGGTDWINLNTPEVSATLFHTIALHPLDQNFMIGGTQDLGTELRTPEGLWLQADTSDGAATLIDQNAGDTKTLTMYHIYFNLPNQLIGFVRAKNYDCAIAGNWDFRGCGPVNPNPGCVNEPIAKPNGLSCQDNAIVYAPMALGPGNPNTVYFGTDRLYRSADQGDTMVPVSQKLQTNFGGTFGVPISAIGISPKDDSLRLVGLINGKVFVSGATPDRMTDISGSIPAGFYVSRAVIDPVDDNIAYVSLNGYSMLPGQHIWKTTNLRSSRPVWNPAAEGIPDIPVNAFVIDPDRPANLYAGTDIGVFRSLNGGKAWEPFNQGLPRVPVFDIAIQRLHRLLRIGTHGRGAWELQLPPISAETADFSLAVEPATVNLQRGGKTPLTVRINRTGAFEGTVSVTLADPKPLKVKITPPSGSTGGTSVEFSLKAKPTASPGTFRLVFTGKDTSGREHTATLNLTIQ